MKILLLALTMTVSFAKADMIFSKVENVGMLKHKVVYVSPRACFEFGETH